MTLRELRERVEAATGADRGIDGHLAVLAGWEWHGDGSVDEHEEFAGHWVQLGFPTNGSFGKRGPGLCDCHTIDPRYGNADDAPCYTASLDAAIALVEAKGFGGHSHTVIDTTGAATAEVWPWGKERPSITRGNGATPALALIAALLMALEQKEQDNG
jgi:hypothetical protein